MEQEEPKVLDIINESITSGDNIDASGYCEVSCDCHCDSIRCEECCMD